MEGQVHLPVYFCTKVGQFVQKDLMTRQPSSSVPSWDMNMTVKSASGDLWICMDCMKEH